MKMTSNSYTKQPESMDDEEQRDALLFGQENPFENEEKAPNDTVKTSSDPSSRYAMIAIAIATVLLALMVVYRPDSIDERVNTLNQLLRIGTGDSKGSLPPVNLPMDKASPSDMMTTPLAPMMTQTVMKMSDVAPGASLSPPVPKSITGASNVMSSSYNNQAGIATAGAMASSSSSITNTMQAVAAQKAAVKNSRLAALPDMNDPQAMHDYVLANYYLYHGFLGDSAFKERDAHSTAKDDPNKVPETEKGAREVVRTQVEGEQHLFIEAFSDPNCVESSAYGFMSFKLNTCTPAWMFSYETQQVYLKNTAYQKESLIFTATDLFSDATCSTPMTIHPVNQTNNQACNAWSSEGNTFAKFNLLDSISLSNLGAGTLVRGHADLDCSESPAETIFFTNSGAGTCQGKFEAVCGESEVSLTRYEDYSCQGGKDNGYPMSFTTSCGYANSLGFSKYGFASCSEASSSSSASVTDLETLLAKEQKKVTEGRGDEAKILGLQQRLAALLQLQPSASSSASASASETEEVAVSTPVVNESEEATTTTAEVVESAASSDTTESAAASSRSEYDHTRTNIQKSSLVAAAVAAAPVVEESTFSTSEQTMKSSAKAEAKAEKKALKLEQKAAKKSAKAEEKEEGKKSEKSSKSSSKSKHNSSKKV